MAFVPTDELPNELLAVPVDDLPDLLAAPAPTRALPARQITREDIIPNESIGQKFIRKLGEGKDALLQPLEAGEGFSPLVSILKRAGVINLIPPFAFQDALAEKAGERVTTETDSPVAGAVTYGTINAINPLAILKALQITGKASKAATALKELEAGKAAQAAKAAEAEQDVLRMFKPAPAPRVPRVPTEEELVTDLLVKSAQDSYRPDFVDKSRGTLKLAPTPRKPAAFPTEQQPLPLSGSIRERELPFGFQPRVVPKSDIPDELLVIGGKEGQLDRLLARAEFQEGASFQTPGRGTIFPGGAPGAPTARGVEQFIKTGTTAIKPTRAKKLLPQEETTARLLLGSPKERVAGAAGEAAPQAPQLSNVGNFMRGIFQESSREVARFGAPGRVLAGDMLNAIHKGEREAGTSVTLMTKAIKALSREEQANLVDVLDIGAAPISRNVDNAANVVRPMLEDVSQRSFRAGITIKNPITGDVIPFTPRPDGNYFPHFSLFDFDEIRNSPTRLAEATREIQTQLARNGKVVSLAEARQTLDIMMRKAQRRFGNLEISRVLDFQEFDRDPTRALTRYLDGAYKRVNMAETFQANFRDADELVNMIGQTSGDLAQKVAKTYVDRITGREELGMFGASGAVIGGAVRGFEVATKLGQAAIANASQSALTVVVAGMQNTLKGLKAVAFGEGSEFAGLTGAVLDSTLNDIQRSLGAGRLSSEVLRKTGFTGIERFNRVLAANAGRAFANDVFSKLQRSLASGSSRANLYRETLTKMDIDVPTALGRGILSLDDQLKAGQNIVRRTQFKTGIQDLPLFATSPLGKTMFQFKTFGFKATQFLKDDIIKEAGRGNIGPLVRASLVLPLSGEVVNSVQSMLNGRSRPESVIDRIADDFAAVGTFGLFYSMIKAVEFGPSAIANILLGPAAGDSISGIYNIAQAVTGNPKGLEKQIIRNIPVVGPAIANRVFPPKTR